MSALSVQNALIESTHLGRAGGNILTWYLYLKYDGRGQGFGGYALDGFVKSRGTRVGGAWGMESIKRVLDVVEVENWEDLPGKHIRVEGNSGKIQRIGHIIKDRWFDPDADLKFLIGKETE